MDFMENSWTLLAAAEGMDIAMRKEARVKIPFMPHLMLPPGGPMQ
jgi:hypothetical protein